MRQACLLAYLILMLNGTSLAAQDEELRSLAWLAGCWSAEDAEQGTVEHWLPLAGGTLLGVSRTVKDGKTRAHEFIQIRRDAEGKILYIALPSGQAEASFRLIASTATEMTFENLEHDFPQRIHYQRMDQERMVARIEGSLNGILKTISFPMKRISCEP